jgi:FkbM family methyltransferase
MMTKINNLDNYTYDFYVEACNLLKNSGFNPNRILDIGASACETADITRRTWPEANILLIEGNDAFEQLYKSKNYQYHIKLLGKESGTTTFYKTKWSPVCSGNSIYRENSNTYNDNNVITETLPIYKLDDVVLNTYDLIKIDTQGSELDIILGGINTFNKAKVVICEVALNDVNLGGCKKEDIINILVRELKFNYIHPIEAVLSPDRLRIDYENLLFIKP